MPLVPSSTPTEIKANPPSREFLHNSVICWVFFKHLFPKISLCQTEEWGTGQCIWRCLRVLYTNPFQMYLCSPYTLYVGKKTDHLIRTMCLGPLHAATLQILRKQLFKDLDTVL